METPLDTRTTTGCTENKDKDTYEHTGGGESPVEDKPQEGEKEREIERGERQRVDHERGSAMADTDIGLGKWHHLFLFSTSYIKYRF